jgi:recombinational DNA repair ATPase RecF
MLPGREAAVEPWVNDQRKSQMSFWERVVGLHAQKQIEARKPPLEALQEAFKGHKTYETHLKSLEARTSLSTQDVVAEAVRFANRHKEAFHDFIYKGEALKQASRGPNADQVSVIVAMMFFLGILIALIVVISGR